MEAGMSQNQNYLAVIKVVGVGGGGEDRCGRRGDGERGERFHHGVHQNAAGRVCQAGFDREAFAGGARRLRLAGPALSPYAAKRLVCPSCDS